MKKPIAFALVFVFTLFLVGCGHASIVEENNDIFSEAVASITTDEVGLTDLAKFEWDTMYSFTPYISQENIEAIIGFSSDDIKETVNEGMTQLLFVKGEKVVCSIYGYSSNLGYGISFGTQYNSEHFLAIQWDETALFTVDHSGEEIRLLYENKADSYGG